MEPIIACIFFITPHAEMGLSGLQIPLEEEFSLI